MTPCALNLATFPISPLSIPYTLHLTIPNQFHSLNVTLLIELIPLKHLYSQSLFHLTLSVVIVSEWSTFQKDGDCSNPMVAQLSDIAIGVVLIVLSLVIS